MEGEFGSWQYKRRIHGEGMSTKKKEVKIMLAETIKSPEEYLSYFEGVLHQTGVFESCLKIKEYYFELHEQFITIYHDEEIFQFEKWGKLLEVDAQIQILLEFAIYAKKDLKEELGMSEEQFVQMIRRDKKTFYRELTGETARNKPRWGLIYLSEE